MASSLARKCSALRQFYHFLVEEGVRAADRGQFALIAGLYIDSKDRIYTTEMFVGRIQVFQYISQPSGSAAVVGGKEVVRTAN